MLLKDKIQIGGSNMRQKGRMGLDRAKDYNFEEAKTKQTQTRRVPGGPGVRTQHFHC